MNAILQSLTLCVTRRKSIDRIKDMVVKMSNTNRQQNILVIDEKLYFSTLISDDEELTNERTVNIKILYECDDEFECLPEVINLANKNVNEDRVCLVTFGLYNNTIIKKLDLSCNDITDDGAVIISDYLKHKSALHTLDISHNKITSDGVRAISDSLKHNNTLKELSLSQNHINCQGMDNLFKYISLEYVDLSGNSSSPWYVYCVIIRHSRVNSLILNGDQGMSKYVQNIKDSLRMNAILQLLTLCVTRRKSIDRIKDMVIKMNNTNRQQNILVIDGKLYFSTLVNNNVDLTNERTVNIKILYDCDGKFQYLPEVINLSNNKVNDDRVCLVTFGLYNNTTVKKLDLSCNNITDNGAVIISDCLKHNSTLQTLDISHNKIADNGIKAIGDSLKHRNTLKEPSFSQDLKNFQEIGDFFGLNYVNFSGNSTSPWYVYCMIIRHSCVKSLVLDADEGMNEYIKELTDSLHANAVLQSLTLYKIGRNELQSIKSVLGDNTTLKELNLSWISKGTNILIHGKLPFKSIQLNSNSCDAIVNINILYDDRNDINDELVKNDDAFSLVAFGLIIAQKIDFSCQNITSIGMIWFIKTLEYNTTLRELNLSQNCIDYKGMREFSQCIKNPMPLVYADLSGNTATQWGFYCAIIRNCSSNYLTLCGDKGMEGYVEEIIDSLQANTSLQSLTLHKIGRYSLLPINKVLHNNITLKEFSLMNKRTKIIHRKHNKFNSKRLDSKNGHEAEVSINILHDNFECSSEIINMSNKNIDDDTVYLISFGLYDTTKTQILDLSCNNITDDGAVAISDCFKSNSSLKELILSKNSIFYKGAWKISELIQENKVISMLNISHNQICDAGAVAISKSLITNNTLKELNLSSNHITSIGVEKLAATMWVNKGLCTLDISQNVFHDDGAIYISNSLKHNNTLLEVNLSKSGITDEGGKYIANAVQVNTALLKLDLSHNNITDNKLTVINGCLKRNSKLQELNLSNTNVSK